MSLLIPSTRFASIEDRSLATVAASRLWWDTHIGATSFWFTSKTIHTYTYDVLISTVITLRVFYRLILCLDLPLRHGGVEVFYRNVMYCSFAANRHHFNYLYISSISYRDSISFTPSSRVLQWFGPWSVRVPTDSPVDGVVVCRLCARASAPETARALRACADRRVRAAISTTALPISSGTRATGGQHRTYTDTGM